MDVQLWDKMERGPLILLFLVKLELGANETCMLNLAAERNKVPFDFYKNRDCVDGEDLRQHASVSSASGSVGCGVRIV